MRVPCMVRWPGKIKTGAVNHELVTAMDFYPTLASMAGYKVPDKPARDGCDISPIWRGAPGATSPHETFFYYLVDRLQAARMGHWKLHLGLTKDQRLDPKKHQLYNLANDLGETTNVAKDHPDIVQEILNRMQTIREDIGDKILNIKGQNERPPAISEHPKPLTEFDPNYPYIEPSYLLNEAG